MNFEICVRHNGKIYCWDSEDEAVKEITAKPVNISECPEIVVFDIMRQLGRVACKYNQQGGVYARLQASV